MLGECVPVVALVQPEDIAQDVLPPCLIDRGAVFGFFTLRKQLVQNRDHSFAGHLALRQKIQFLLNRLDVGGNGR